MQYFRNDKGFFRKNFLALKRASQKEKGEKLFDWRDARNIGSTSPFHYILRPLPIIQHPHSLPR